MNVTTNTIVAINRDFAQVPLSRERVEPVRLEVEQFTTSIEAVRTRATFDCEQAHFIVALLADTRGALRD